MAKLLYYIKCKINKNNSFKEHEVFRTLQLAELLVKENEYEKLRELLF